MNYIKLICSWCGERIGDREWDKPTKETDETSTCCPCCISKNTSEKSEQEIKIENIKNINTPIFVLETYRGI